jgi:hypothetical protein
VCPYASYLQGAPDELLRAINPRALNTLRVEKFFSIMRSQTAMPSALQWLIARSSAVYEEYKRRLAEEGLLGWDLWSNERYGRGHYAGVAASSVAATAVPVFKRHKPQPKGNKSPEEMQRRQDELRLLRDEAAEQKPVRTKKPTDHGRYEVGTLPLNQSCRRREGGVPAAHGSVLDGLSLSVTTARAKGKQKKVLVDVEKELLVSMGDVVVVKAVKHAEEMFWLGQMKESVVRETTYSR